MPFNPTDHEPKTLEEAVDLIDKNLDDGERDYIRAEGVIGLHHGPGTALRNAWLWKAEHPLSQHFRTRFGLGHADDMSSLILDGLEAKVNGKPYDPMPHVEEFKQHWRDAGVDPLTAGT